MAAFRKTIGGWIDRLLGLDDIPGPQSAPGQQADWPSEWVQVDSTNISAIGYLPIKGQANGDMFVKFVSGSVYRYHGVPRGEFAAFINSPSKGKHMWYVIRQEGLDTLYDPKQVI